VDAEPLDPGVQNLSSCDGRGEGDGKSCRWLSCRITQCGWWVEWSSNKDRGHEMQGSISSLECLASNPTEYEYKGIPHRPRRSIAKSDS
jgi:hypothetical protein